jgi:glutathione S-transferase
MMKLYQFDFSPFCIKVRAVLHLKDLPYEVVEVLPLLTQHQVERASGQRRVPVLVDGDTTVADSTEIALYLDTLRPDPPLLPADPAARRRALLWEDWADDTLAFPIRALAFDAVRRDPALGREQLPPFGNAAVDLLIPRFVPLVTRALIRHYRISDDEIRRARPRLERALDLLTDELQGRSFLVGDHISLADIGVASILRNVDTIPDVRAIPRLQALFAWRDGVLATCRV